jgi:hypothetical protein
MSSFNSLLSLFVFYALLLGYAKVLQHLHLLLPAVVVPPHDAAPVAAASQVPQFALPRPPAWTCCPAGGLPPCCAAARCPAPVLLVAGL